MQNRRLPQAGPHQASKALAKCVLRPSSQARGGRQQRFRYEPDRSALELPKELGLQEFLSAQQPESTKIRKREAVHLNFYTGGVIMGGPVGSGSGN